ncbi:MAG: radical SAM protein, partial [Clostridium sp.]
KKIIDEKKIKKLFLESHWCYKNRLQEMRDFFGIEIIFKIGVETFDNNFRNLVLNKNANFKTVDEVKENFQSVCLLVGIKGQTKEMIQRDINLVLENFKYATINVFINNSTEIKRDEELVQWFADNFRYLEDYQYIEVLYNNTDFGVGD